MAVFIFIGIFNNKKAGYLKKTKFEWIDCFATLFLFSFIIAVSFAINSNYLSHFSVIFTRPQLCITTSTFRFGPSCWATTNGSTRCPTAKRWTSGHTRPTRTSCPTGWPSRPSSDRRTRKSRPRALLNCQVSYLITYDDLTYNDNILFNKSQNCQVTYFDNIRWLGQ